VLFSIVAVAVITASKVVHIVTGYFHTEWLLKFSSENGSGNGEKKQKKSCQMFVAGSPFNTD